MGGTKAAPQAGDRTHPGIRLPNRESETARSAPDPFRELIDRIFDDAGAEWLRSQRGVGPPILETRGPTGEVGA